MRLKGTTEVGYLLGLHKRTIQYRCEKLGYAKEGRDFRLDGDQIKEIREYSPTHPPGRPKKH